MGKLFNSLQTKLMLLLIIVALPGVFGLIYYSFIERHDAINSATQRAINTVDISTKNQTKLIQETQRFLQDLSVHPALLNPNSPECSDFLADILKFNPNYINLGVPLANGDLFCNAKPLSKPINVADRPYIQQALSSLDFSIGQFQVDRSAGITSINFAYPVIDPISSKIIGLVVAVVSLEWWSKHLSESHLPDNSVAYITDAENIIVATYPTNEKLVGIHLNRVQSELFKSDSSLARDIQTLKSANNHLRLFTSRPLFEQTDDATINMSLGISLDEEFVNINMRLLKMALILIFFISLMTVVALWGIRKSVLFPLKDLVKSTKNLELGVNFENHQIKGSSEFVELQKHFNSMAKTRLLAEQQLKISQLSLQKSENRLSLHISNTPLGCISWDKDLICTRWNKSAENIFGYSQEEAIGRGASELVRLPIIAKNTSLFSELLVNQQNGSHTNDSLAKDNHLITCEWHNTPILSEDNSFIGITSLVQDITKKKQLEEQLTLAASVFSHAKEGIIITDASGIILDVNDTFVSITGYQRDEVLGENPRILKSNQQTTKFYRQLWVSLMKNGYWYGEIWNRRKNNEVYPQLTTISAVRDEHGKVKSYVSLFTDISEAKQHQLQLEHMAQYDFLTGLPNRSLLADRLEQAIIQSKRSNLLLAVVFLDLDGFKQVNDEYGHKFGDGLLIELALRIKKALRDGDTLSRFGGDEFVIVMTSINNIIELETILLRLLTATSEPILVLDTSLKVSASIGVTLYPTDNTDPDQLIRHADQAMYIAKQKGKNCYHLFDLESEGLIKDRFANIQRIDSGLKNNEFILYYQPKVNIRTGEIIGVEALIRWQHPTRGLLDPIDFLPIIDDHSASIRLGEWVLENSLSQIAKWQSEGIHLSISVNISAQQLQQKDFADRLAYILAAHPDVSPDRLQLEVLETSALGNVNDASEIMKKCVKLGIKFAIDDFGTGYSSLTYLKRLPANLIKIDQSFIRDMLVDPEDWAIVAGVIALAKSFDRSVIAEGVETIAHGKALLELGCELAQGYGIARPMPASKIPDWKINWHPAEAWQSNPNDSCDS